MISIIMPVYNVEKYVGIAIESILKQTYMEWELIIVDDGSDDNSLKICNEYAQIDRRIRIVSKKNGGVSSARNKGLEYAQGEWIYFMDADDRVVENCFETIIEYLREEEVDIVCWNYMRECSDGIKKAAAIFPDKFIEEEPKKLIKEVIFPGYSIKELHRFRGAMRTLCTKLFRRNIIIGYFRFNEEIKIGEDALFCAMCCQRAQRILFVNEYLYYYRKVPNSADQRYREDIEDVFVQLLKSTYQFLEEGFGEIETNTCFAGLVYDCVARALEKKFVNAENPAKLSERLNQMKGFMQSKWVLFAFNRPIDWSAFKPKHKAVLFCMKRELYFGLYVLQKIKELKEKRDEIGIKWKI